MRKVPRTLVVAVSAGLVASVVPSAFPTPASAAGTQAEYVVTFDSDVEAAARARKERALGNEVSEVFSDAVDAIVATLDANDVRRLRNDADVVAVEPNAPIRVAATPGRYIVKLRTGTGALGVASSIGATNVVTFSRAINGFAADLTADAYDALAADPNVVAIEPDRQVSTSDTQLSPVSWGLDRIDQRSLPLDRSYTYPARGAGVRAYVVDTGVRSTHVQFAGRVVAGFDGIQDGNGTNDCNGHGTHVAGTIAGVTAGVAKSSTVVPVRVLGCDGRGWMSTVLAGIDWIIADHAPGQPAVANLSLGGAKSTIVNEAIARGVADGVVFVLSAGNANDDACNYSPASEPVAITVGASSSGDGRASFSNWGSCLDVFAPGVGITSASATDDTVMRSLSGTSMAAPHVAGVAALALSMRPAASPAEIAADIVRSSTIGALSSIGAGSPNRFLFADTNDVPSTTTTAPTTTVAPTTSVVTTTTLAPTTSSTAPTTTTTVVVRPTNDNFAMAAGLVGASGLVAASNTSATREPTEPSHGGVGGSASLWYRWTAPADGDLVVATGSTSDSTITSNFDTLLGVYTGSDIGSLLVRGSNDDYAAASGHFWSRVAIEVVGGTTYSIAVDGWSGRTGDVKLSWNFTALDNSVLPSAPRGVAATALDGAVWVSWLAPTTLGRGTLSYTATVSPGGQSCGTVGLRCLVAGLVNGTTYSVTVTARNSAGEGPASDPRVSFVPQSFAGRPNTTRAWGVDRLDQRTNVLDGTVTRPVTGRLASVYVLDTGVNAQHAEFTGRVQSGYNSVNWAPPADSLCQDSTDPTNTNDLHRHGTHVAGTIAGATLGVAPEAAIVPVKVLDCRGGGSTASVIAGIDWMVNHHQAGVPAVANLSLGGGGVSLALNAAVARAVADGITVVVAAGNSTDDACTTSPASEPLAITVGATDRQDKRTWFSNFGACVDIFAPGSFILSAGIGSPTAEEVLSGTSMAAPHVAGAAALLLDAMPSATPAEVARVIRARSTKGAVLDRGAGSPDELLYIGTDEQQVETAPQPSTETTTAPPPVASVAPTPSTDAAPTTTISSRNSSPRSKIRATTANSRVNRPTARIVRANSDRVLVRISNARGAVDVLVNGKTVVTTKKRVLVIKSKGVASKRITVRASRLG